MPGLMDGSRGPRDSATLCFHSVEAPPAGDEVTGAGSSKT
jgi:hypothetical protein